MIRAVLAAAALLLAAASPPLRADLIELEPALPSLLFTAALAGGLAGWLFRVRGDAAAVRRLRRFEAPLSRALGTWGWALAVLLFLLPLWSHWAFKPPSHISAFAALAGYIPWSDCSAHFEGGNRLLAEGRFGLFSERRPLSDRDLLAMRAPFVLLSAYDYVSTEQRLIVACSRLLREADDLVKLETRPLGCCFVEAVTWEPLGR